MTINPPSESDLSISLLLLVVIVGTPFFLFMDSPWFTALTPYGQEITNGIMVVIYCVFLLVARRKLYWLILLMTIASLSAETLGSLVLVLYQYRLKNIPMYIPLGHAIIYGSIYLFCKQPFVWRHHRKIENILAKFAFVVSFMSLFILNDIAGFLCYILFLFILHYRKKPLFYLCMFVMVYYVELCGTVFSTWSWYVVLGNHPNFPPIGYTPSGMAGMYILIDLVSNSVYFRHRRAWRYLNKMVPRWQYLLRS